MSKSEVTYHYSITDELNGLSFEVKAHNPSDKIAFFIEFMLVDERTGERRTLTGTAGMNRSKGGEGLKEQKRLKDGKRLKIVMQGFNL